MKFLLNSIIETFPNPTPAELQSAMEIKIENFKTDLSQSMMMTLELLREMIHINQLVTIYRSNWRFAPLSQSSELDHPDGVRVQMVPVRYESCDCGLSKYCMKPISDTDGVNITGLMLGCYPLEAFLKSTLECFYEQSCFQRMVDTSYIPIDVATLIVNISLPSRYYSNATVEEILNDAFVEEWSSHISYEQYYTACAVSSCSYSYLRSASVVEIITDLLGLYGGLTIVIGGIVVPLLIWLGSLSKKPSGRVDIVAH